MTHRRVIAGLLAFVPIVVLPAPTQEPDLDTLPVLRLVEEMRIGDVDDPDVGFSHIGSVDVDRDGNVYVFEMQDHQIRVYSPRGQLLRKIGRRGAGPGEFTSAVQFGVVGDTVWTLETQGSGPTRMTLFNRVGAVLTTARIDGLRVPVHNNFGVVRPRMMRTDGKFVGDMNQYTSSPNDPPRNVKPGDTIPVPRLLWDAKGAIIDTLGWDRQLPPEGGAVYVAIESAPRHRVPQPMTDRPLIIPALSGRFIIDRTRPTSAAIATLRVTHITQTGDTLYSRRYRYHPVRYTSEVLDGIVAQSASLPGNGYRIVNGKPEYPKPFADINNARALIRGKISFPPFQTPVQSHILGDDGGLWLRREYDTGGSSRWVVLDPKGTPRGRIDMTNAGRFMWSSGDLLWAVRTDEFSVEWLVKYRIR